MNSFLKKFELYIFSSTTKYCNMSTEIIQSVVAYDNYDDFQHINLIFSQFFILLF
jgi:hypothetical protein